MEQYMSIRSNHVDISEDAKYELASRYHNIVVDNASKMQIDKKDYVKQLNKYEIPMPENLESVFHEIVYAHTNLIYKIAFSSMPKFAINSDNINGCVSSIIIGMYNGLNNLDISKLETCSMTSNIYMWMNEYKNRFMDSNFSHTVRVPRNARRLVKHYMESVRTMESEEDAIKHTASELKICERKLRKTIHTFKDAFTATTCNYENISNTQGATMHYAETDTDTTYHAGYSMLKAPDKQIITNELYDIAHNIDSNDLLSNEEKTIIKHSFGIGGEDRKSDKIISGIMNMCTATLNKKKKIALKKLRSHIEQI